MCRLVLMSLQAECSDRISTISRNTQSLDDMLKVLSERVPDATGADLPPRESIEFNFTLACAIANLYLSQLQCQGIDTRKHSIHHELERLASYTTKLVESNDGMKRQRLSTGVNRVVSQHIKSNPVP
jgi:hypothetical protein